LLFPVCARCFSCWRADVVDIDTAGLAALEGMRRDLASRGVQVRDLALSCSIGLSERRCNTITTQAFHVFLG
jgi:hypothetical protein